MFASLLKSLFKKREETAAAARRDESGDVVKPFLDHLEDLRWTIMKVAFTLVIAMGVCFVWHSEVFRFLQRPLIINGYNPGEVLVTDGIVAPFMTAITLAFYVGILVSFPFLTYFLGEFVMPALTTREKRYAMPALFVGFLLFLGGAWFSFWYVTPSVVQFMADFAVKNGQKVQYTVKSYYSFVAMMSIAFGLLCQLPVVMVTLNGIGIVSYKWIASTRRYAIGGIFVLCAIVSPSPDIASLLLFALPLIGLYELCIWIIWFLDRRRERKQALEDRRMNMPYDDKNEPLD